MADYAVRYSQPLLGNVDARGRLAAVPGASVLIRQDGVACDVYADKAKTPMANPVPTGVTPGAAGLDSAGNLTVYLEPGCGYSGISTVGMVSTTFAIPDIAADINGSCSRVRSKNPMLASGGRHVGRGRCHRRGPSRG